MNYANIFFDDAVNGMGFRTSLFVSGCAKTPPCEGCWSPQARNFDYGKLYTTDTKFAIMSSLNEPYIKGLSILGGEPTDNLEDEVLLDLVKSVRLHFPNKTIYCWSGYTFEELIKKPKVLEFLHYIDMLRDGAYVKELRNVTQYLNGSSNQRIINVQDSLEQGVTVLYKDSYFSK